jgi:hypothetical protein
VLGGVLFAYGLERPDDLGEVLLVEGVGVPVRPLGRLDRVAGVGFQVAHAHAPPVGVLELVQRLVEGVVARPLASLVVDPALDIVRGDFAHGLVQAFMVEMLP